MKNDGLAWRLEKLIAIKEKLKNGAEIDDGEKMALEFWRRYKWLLKEE